MTQFLMQLKGGGCGGSPNLI